MEQELGGKKTDSVFDFIYADHRRIGLFLSQFSDFGNLTSLVHSHSVSGDTGVAGGIPGVASGEAKRSHETAIQRHFDTQWFQTLNFLDEVRARNMLRRNIDGVPIGGLLLIPGALYLVNMRPFARTWDVVADTVSTPMRTPVGNRHQRRASGHPPQANENLSGLKILGSVDQPVFMIFRSGDMRMWSTLDPDFLTGGGSDLNLKHGVKVTGEWHLLAILDCPPGANLVAESDIGRLSGGGGNTFSASILRMWEEYRLILGRPDDCYGVTPLVIMREVA